MTSGALVARETAVSVVVNALLSAVFFHLVFGGLPAVRAWGRAGLVVDFLPQGFMIGLMGALVPGLIARRAAASGRFEKPARLHGTIRAVFGRAVAAAALAAALAVGVSAALFALSGAAVMPFGTAFTIKVAGGALLALIVTPPAVRSAIH